MVKPQGDCANTHTHRIEPGCLARLAAALLLHQCCPGTLCFTVQDFAPRHTISRHQLSGTLTSTGHGAVACAWGGLWPLLLNMAHDTPVLVKSFFFT